MMARRDVIAAFIGRLEVGGPTMADFVAPKPSHPETCPNCGKLTWNWKWLAVRQWFECEHCGFSGKASSTPGFKRA